MRSHWLRFLNVKETLLFVLLQRHQAITLHRCNVLFKKKNSRKQSNQTEFSLYLRYHAESCERVAGASCEREAGGPTSATQYLGKAETLSSVCSAQESNARPPTPIMRSLIYCFLMSMFTRYLFYQHQYNSFLLYI